MVLTSRRAGHSRQPQQVDDWPPARLGPRETTKTGLPEGLSGEEDQGGVQQREPEGADQRQEVRIFKTRSWYWIHL